MSVAVVAPPSTCRYPGCEGVARVRGLCRSCYNYHHYRGTLDDVASVDLCSRCQVQLGAYAGDSGRGDRPLLAGTMTMAEAAAYMLGFFDARSRRDAEAIDPYIVQRFHELRMERGANGRLA